MTRICLIGDPHFANRAMFGYPVPGRRGRSTRLDNIVRVFEEIDNTLTNDYPDVRDVWVMGDLTHNHGLLTPVVFQAVQYSLRVLGHDGYRNVQGLTGNHDLDINGLSILKVFEDDEVFNVHDPDECHPQYYEGVRIIPISYGSNLAEHFDILRREHEQGDKDPVILLMHHHFEGAVHGPHEFEPPGGVLLKDIPPNVLLVASGHYHKRQWIKDRVLYIGAPIQHDFGEADYEPGITILTVDLKPTIEHVSTPSEVAPRFRVLSHTITPDKLPGRPASDYYRVDLPMDVDPNSIAWLKDKVKHLIVKPIPSTNELRSRVTQYFSEIGQERAEGKVELGDVIEAYTVLNVEEKDRQDELIQLGMEIANKVVGGS